MTVTIERPAAAVWSIPRYAVGCYPCPKGVPWCNDAAAASEEDHATCWSGEQYLPATGGRLRDGRLGGGTHFVSVLLEETRDREPTIALNVTYAIDDLGEADAATMTLDEAEQLARFLLDRVAMLRGGEIR
ncbi:hypothetical protein GCM10009827_083980 [Dactylosporangium maewongense]|uniref:Uncharacterized protein n=1 Tax=Dactylosporangium maewongense TaxID=634393 RepID=A0ABN2C3E3_9ACTN